MGSIFTIRDGRSCPQEKEKKNLHRTQHSPGNNGLLSGPDCSPPVMAVITTSFDPLPKPGLS
jgi:hypothetical protein